MAAENVIPGRAVHSGGGGGQGRGGAVDCWAISRRYIGPTVSQFVLSFLAQVTKSLQAKS